VEGKCDQLVAKICERYEITDDEAELQAPRVGEDVIEHSVRGTDGLSQTEAAEFKAYARGRR